MRIYHSEDLDTHESPVAPPRMDWLRNAIDRLPANQRRAVELVYFQQLPRAHAAVEMGLPIGKFDGLLTRAHKALRPTVQRNVPGHEVQADS